MFWCRELTTAESRERVWSPVNQPGCRLSTTIQEINGAIKMVQLSKWKFRWDNTEYDRAYPMLVPKVDSNKFLDIPSRKSFYQDRIFET